MKLEGSVLLVGAGGLGCGAALAMAAAGVPHLVVLDDDVVDVTNLHRQVLHGEAAVGMAKAESLAATLFRRFPGTQVTPTRARLDAGNAAELAGGHAVIVDASDNLGTKFLLNDLAVLYGIPMVHGAAIRSSGQVLTVPAGGRPCYRCLFEDLPPAGSGAAPTCAQVGVLGPVPGVIGAMQAQEAARLLAGSPALVGCLLIYDGAAMTMRTARFWPKPACRICGERPSITALDPAAYLPRGVAA